MDTDPTWRRRMWLSGRWRTGKEREPALSEESRVPETLGKHLALTQLPSPHLSSL